MNPLFRPSGPLCLKIFLRYVWFSSFKRKNSKIKFPLWSPAKQSPPYIGNKRAVLINGILSQLIELNFIGLDIGSSLYKP